MEFFVKQPLCGDTDFELAAVLAQGSANLLALAGARTYIQSRDIALDVVLLLQALPLCLVRRDIAHMCIFITGH